MGKRRLRVITDLANLDGFETDEYVVEARQIEGDESFGGGARLFRQAFGYDIVLLNSSTRRLLAPVSYTHLRAHETVLDLVCRLLLEKKKTKQSKSKKDLIFSNISSYTQP